uniref:phycobilisome degradation protein n=1 Tax=Hypnea wynnei TaxID=1867777 RepID=UPI0027D9DB07|nr:phycobilisome degradation protein [Hypnea wynnei]WCH56486.1 phycobilisome degradation protein [Hypnea wynnei]
MQIYKYRMNNINNLTLEQEFKLAIYKQKIYKLDDKNIKKHLILILQQMMIKDNIIKYFIKNSTP